MKQRKDINESLPSFFGWYLTFSPNSKLRGCVRDSSSVQLQGLADIQAFYIFFVSMDGLVHLKNIS